MQAFEFEMIDEATEDFNQLLSSCNERETNFFNQYVHENGTQETSLFDEDDIGTFSFDYQLNLSDVHA